MPTIAQNSIHRKAFDHTVNKDLPSFLPLPIVELLSFDGAWKKVIDILSGKRLLLHALEGEQLIQWQVNQLSKRRCDLFVELTF